MPRKGLYDPAYAKAYRLKHRERIKTYMAEYYKGHPAVRKRLRDGNRRRRQERKLYIQEYLLSHPCVDCGKTDPIVLEFDHVRGRKVKEISRFRCHNLTWIGLLKEIEKCDVRCANCHRRKTARERGYYSGLAINKPAVNQP